MGTDRRVAFGGRKRHTKRVDAVKRGDGSRMPDYADVMTVRQMIDVVAFLQKRYVVVRPTLAARPEQ